MFQKVCLGISIIFMSISGISAFRIWRMTATPDYSDLYELSTQQIIKDSQKAPGIYVIHAPKTGCPAHWSIQKSYFVEEDNTHEDACFAVVGKQQDWQNMSIDYLKKGEGAIFSFELFGTKPPTGGIRDVI